jgi:carboxymethylenebutenolidase
MEAELAGDLDRTMATMTANPHLVNVPTMVGGQGPEGVRRFYANRLIGQFFPPDVKFETISRTYGAQRLVDELIISFTHTTEMDHFLPGVKPTGKYAEVVVVVIVGFEEYSLGPGQPAGATGPDRSRGLAADRCRRGRKVA